MRTPLLFASLVLVACTSTPESPPPRPQPVTFELASVTQLVPLDAVDGLTLPEELSRTIEGARARIPERIDSKQKDALDELESRYERLEAGLEGGEKDRERGRLLGAYYWERLRLFAPDLADAPPDAMLSAFERATGRGE